GPVLGSPSQYEEAVSVWRGIPFAAPPVGPGRWRAPAAPEPWSEPREALQAGAHCEQPLVPVSSIYSRGAIDPSEDCLYLNVWAPDDADAPLPVLVWFHGGGNTTGQADSLVFDGSHLASKGAIVVTAKYRLGLLGFFAHPELTAESGRNASGNYGLMDQLAALRWVQANADAFGGDPERVVISGQSAGAIDVCLLMTSPESAGLMSGVIGISGGCLFIDRTLAEAEAAGLALSAELAGAQLDDLRSLPLETLTLAAETTAQVSSPIVDGWIVPEAPRVRFRTGRFNQVPLIVGDVADEFRGLAADLPPMPRADFEAVVRDRFPDAASRVLEAYADLAADDPREAFRKLSTHSFFTWQSRAWATHVGDGGPDAWVYHFTHPAIAFNLYIPERRGYWDPKAPRALGAYHSGDLPYHFNNLSIVGLGWESWDFLLADMVSSYWVNFARTGNPNGPALPSWRSYDPEHHIVQKFGTRQIWQKRHPERVRLDLFDELFSAEAKGPVP
ncbi:MAG: carboxylesterase family protein, partial [Pseudomonadota bacterium]